MNSHSVTIEARVLDAMTVVSPQQLGGECKDQDRARWFPGSRVALVSDGVSSSPSADVGAETIAASGEKLFEGDVHARLKELGEELLRRRAQIQDRRLHLPEHLSETAREMVLEIACERLKHAVQSTVVAAKFEPRQDAVRARILACGDSAFLAFAPSGEPLMSTVPTQTQCRSNGTVCAAPQEDLLIEVLATATHYPLFARQGGIPAARTANWSVCALISTVPKASRDSAAAALWPTRGFGKGDVLLIPRQLLRPFGSSRIRRRVRCSPQIIAVSDSRVRDAVHFAEKGPATAVVPDDVGTECCRILEERFPKNTHFVLATDGFYAAFGRPSELWAWLTFHQTELNGQGSAASCLRNLHQKRYERQGDDDISFVWVRPAAPQESGHVG